jgi:hypothetical protein
MECVSGVQYVSVLDTGHRHNSDTCDHIQLIHFFQIFTGVDVSMSCHCHIWCLCLC